MVKSSKKSGPKMTMAQAFDEWERKYEADPERFGNCMQAFRDHKKKSATRGVSQYGHSCAALLEALMANGKKAWG